MTFTRLVTGNTSGHCPDTCLQNVEYGGWGRTLLSGWGRVQEGGDWSRNLKRARLPIVTDQECTRNVSGHTV